MGKNIQTAMQIYKRECASGKEHFIILLLKHISGRTEKAIRKSRGDEMFLEPEKLTELEDIRTLLCWPGVGKKVLNDLAEGLEEAGYESFVV